MSFAFQFDDSEVDDEYVGQQPDTAPTPPPSSAPTAGPSVAQAPFREWPLTELLDSLPSRVSYSPIKVPLDPRDGQKRQATLMRRDLFDARFQMLLDQDDEDHESDTGDAVNVHEAEQDEEKKAVAGVDSDLVPGVYEGGLKTWECSLDLVATLDQRSQSIDAVHSDWNWLRGKSIIELGCGTAVPSLFLLQQLFNLPVDEASTSTPTALHLCDYNLQVLRLVTLPNLLLGWYFSSASEAYRTSEETLNSLAEENKQLKSRGQDHFDTATQAVSNEMAGPGELAFDEALFAAFQKSLDERNISLRFFSGSWQGLHPKEILAANNAPSDPGSVAVDGYFDLILSAETIYSLDTLPLFTDVLRRCCKPSQPSGLSGLDERLSRSSLSQERSTSASSHPASEQRAAEPATLCLVGAKVLYFGVGGGVETFKQQMLAPPQGCQKGWTETVRTISQGVGRVVLSVGVMP